MTSGTSIVVRNPRLVVPEPGPLVRGRHGAGTFGARSSSTRTRRRYFPTIDFGSSLRNSTWRGTLNGGEVQAAELDDLLLARRLAGLQDHEGLHRLAAVGVGHPGHHRLADLRVHEEHLLHLAGEHLEAGGVDHVLAAVDDVEEAVGVHAGDVAGAEPAVVEDLGRLLGPPPVAEHHLRPAHLELALLARRQRLAASSGRRSAPPCPGRAGRCSPPAARRRAACSA